MGLSVEQLRPAGSQIPNFRILGLTLGDIKMTQSKQAGPVTLVLSDAQNDSCMSIATKLSNSVNAVEDSIEESAVLLGTAPSLELWESVMLTIKSLMVSSLNIAEKTAENKMTSVRNGLKELGLTRPQSAKAEATAKKRAELEAGYAHMSDSELAMLAVDIMDNGTAEELSTIKKVRKARIKNNAKAEDLDTKDLIKDSIKNISDWIKKDNDLETQKVRAVQLIAFINKQS